MSILVVVEAPGKVKTLSKYLGSEYVVRPTIGHIMDLAVGRGGDIGVDIDNGFVPRYEVMPDKVDKIKAILDAARSADEILVASDPDREGEGIAFHIREQLKGLKKPIKRIVFNEIEKKAVQKAVKNPRDFDQNLYDAQQARRVLDRIVGFMVSPYLSHKLGDKLSAGRVQSVALRMIVDREREIEAFKPDTFYNISATLAKGQGKLVAKYPKRVENDDEAKQIKEDLDTAKYVVQDISGKDVVRKAPPPLTTAKLQQEAGAKLKFKIDRTMKAAQELYEGGFVSYIRTDSTRNSADSIENVRQFISKQGMSVPSVPNEFKNADQAQDAHEAIRPSDINALPDKVALTDDQKKIYELIWRMFVASQMEPAVFNTVKVTIKATKDQKEHLLIAEGKTIKQEGWLSMVKQYTKEKEAMLPTLVKGDVLTLTPPKVKSEKSQTKPPPRFSEHSLVEELERKAIGRPSTYASIIARISVRQYVKTTAQGFEPTDLGRSVSDDLKDNFTFMDYKYTADMEKKLDKVADGKLGYVPMLTEFFSSFKTEFQKARGNQGMHTDIPCPKCGGETVVRKSKYGYFAGCIKYKAGCDGLVGITMEDGKPALKASRANVMEDILCPDCGAGMVSRPDGKFGPYYGCSKYPQCKGKRKMPFGKKCPKCGNELYATLMIDKMKLACMGYPNCKHVENLPEGSNINWVDPQKVTPPTYSKKVENVLKKQKD